MGGVVQANGKLIISHSTAVTILLDLISLDETDRRTKGTY